MSLLSSRSRASKVLVMLAGAIAMSSAAHAGRVINVSTSADLQNAVRNALAGDEIIVAPGTYYPTLFLTISANNVTVRGATGNRDDVIIRGAGMNVDPPNGNREGFALYGDNATIKDLTVAEYFFHAIHFQPGADAITISNVVTRNNGEQHIKGAKYNAGGLIENTLCEQTYVRTNGWSTRPDDYVGGIDLHGGIDFVIRDTMVRNIQGAGGDADGALFAWDLCRNITMERCIVIGCDRGICFGNNSGGQTGYHVDGGIVRNCFVYARTAYIDPASTSTPWLYNADCAIDAFSCRNVNFYNNTIWTDSGSYGRTIRVGIAQGPSYGNLNLQFKYNIVRGNFQLLTPGSWTSTGDITGNIPQANWFWDASTANLHLTKRATAAIGQATSLAEVPADFDEQTRPLDGTADIGADEFLAADINGDGHCDTVDLLTLIDTFGKSLGQAGYNPLADFNGDNAVDVVDLLTLVYSFGL